MAFHHAQNPIQILHRPYRSLSRDFCAAGAIFKALEKFANVAKEESAAAGSVLPAATTMLEVEGQWKLQQAMEAAPHSAPRGRARKNPAGTEEPTSLGSSVHGPSCVGRL